MHHIGTDILRICKAHVCVDPRQVLLQVGSFALRLMDLWVLLGQVLREVGEDVPVDGQRPHGFEGWGELFRTYVSWMPALYMICSIPNTCAYIYDIYIYVAVAYACISRCIDNIHYYVVYTMNMCSATRLKRTSSSN